MERGEVREQARFIQWTHRPAVRQLAPAPPSQFHCPNVGKRDAITGPQMHTLGVKPGGPALLMPVVSSARMVDIEMKAADGRATPAQGAWLDALMVKG